MKLESDGRCIRPLSSPSPGVVERLLVRLNRRYVAVLVAVALLAVLDQAVIQPALLRLNFYGPVINVAGRQRMLSQRLTKAALAIQASKDESERRRYVAELSLALRQWTQAHQGLQHGDRQLGLPGTQTPEIVEAFRQLEPSFQAMKQAAGLLVALPGEAREAGDMRALGHSRLVQTIQQHESHYLEIMDHVVGMFEAEAHRQVGWLRFVGFLLMAILLMLVAGAGAFIVRPGHRMIQQQVRALRSVHHALEKRVVERTEQLREANEALKDEIQRRQRMAGKTHELANQLAHLSRVRAIGQLAGGLAHELNQPLAVVTNYAETCQVLLDRRPLPAESLNAHLQRISKAALRAGEIIRRMRNFVRPQFAQRSDVDLNALVHEVAELCRPEISRAEVTMEFELAVPSPHMKADTIQIQQVLVNLIQNALQAMQDCSPNNRQLRIRSRIDEFTVHVEVIDTGSGFPEKETEPLFSPFVSTKPDGLGMGLAISRSIIAEHQGRLWASNSETGATVGFTLPLSQSHEAKFTEADGVCRR